MNSENQACWMFAALRDAGWFSPPFMRMGYLDDVNARLRAAAPADRPAILEEALQEMYGPVHLAGMVEHRYSATPIVRDRIKTIDSAIQAYFLGLYEPALCALLPAVESSIVAFARASGRTKPGSLAAEVRQWIKHAEERQIGAHDEVVEMLQGFEEFILKVYDHSASKARDGDLNRNGILHGLFRGSDTRRNCLLLFSVLDMLTFASSYRTSGLGFFAPNVDDASMHRAKHYGLLAVVGHHRLASPPVDASRSWSVWPVPR